LIAVIIAVGLMQASVVFAPRSANTVTVHFSTIVTLYECNCLGLWFSGDPKCGGGNGPANN
jgi:hypothetical protein